MKKRLFAAVLLLIPASSWLAAQTGPATDPWCQEHVGQRTILGRFPNFSCVERGPDCQLYPSPCTPSEIALIIFFGGQSSAPPATRVRPSPARSRSKTVPEGMSSRRPAE